jgi:hypothetical protein
MSAEVSRRPFVIRAAAAALRLSVRPWKLTRRRAINAWKSARNQAARSRKLFFYRARLSPAGRVVLHATSELQTPRESFERRLVAARYRRRFPAVPMVSRNGYALIGNDFVPEFDGLNAVCQELFHVKTGHVHQGSPDHAYKTHDRKAFLRNLLSNGDLRQYPELLEFALSDRLLSAAANYLRTIPHLNRIDLLYSVSRDSSENVASQLFHVDPEGLSQAKVFINLIEVGDAQGPLTFIPAGESARILEAIRVRRRAAGEPEFGRYSDKEILAVGGFNRMIKLTGPAGSGAIIDTSRCLHCGSRVQPGAYRLCLYIQYCTSRERGNVFDAERYSHDRVRFLAVANSLNSRGAVISAPHQMA